MDVGTRFVYLTQHPSALLPALQVYKATFRDAPCAVKREQRRSVKAKSVASMTAEIAMMSRLHHPRIVQFLGCCFEPYGTRRHARAPTPQPRSRLTHSVLTTVCLLVELMPRGSLRSLLKTKGFHFEWSKHMSIAHDLAAALAYLHAFNPPIVHRDVKPDNVSATTLSRVGPTYSTFCLPAPCAITGITRRDRRSSEPSWCASWQTLARRVSASATQWCVRFARLAFATLE